MRTTRDLIAELRMEAANADYVLLAVGFPTETKFVCSDLDDTKALEALNDLVTRGGHPLGFISKTSGAGRRVTFRPRPLAEHADDPVPMRVLQDICRRSAEILIKQYGGSVDQGEDGDDGR